MICENQWKWSASSTSCCRQTQWTPFGGRLPVGCCGNLARLQLWSEGGHQMVWLEVSCVAAAGTL
eukprot:3997835-Amphidinium_carterae.1